MSKDQKRCVYILGCSDGTYYVGSARDVVLRVRKHNAGRGPRYTAARLPVRLLYQESCNTLEEALRREVQIKHWSRAKKEALIAGDMAMLKRLSKKK